MTETFEQFYEDCHEAGGMSQYRWDDDPRLMAFYLARYKHVAKMVEGFNHVLEIGCSDGYGSRIVRQHVKKMTAIDVDARAIDEAKKNKSDKWPVEFHVGDPLWATRQRVTYDAVFSLDVLEHIEPSAESVFLRYMHQLSTVAIIGTPSMESQVYASRLSKAGHVNCKTGNELKIVLRRHWPHVFMFSMNDEAIGTGFLPMAHYLLALCVR